jgi:hypothetical protein
LNPLDVYGSTTLSNGNLDASLSTTGQSVAVGTISVASGKWYWEVAPVAGGQWNIGIANTSAANKSGFAADGWYYYADGRKLNAGSYTGYGSSFTGGDIIGVALDMDTGSITFYKNNVSQGVAFNTGIAGKLIQPALNISATATYTFTANFGQRAFAYTAPSGFKALCTQNLPAPLVTKPNTVMDVALYTGTGAAQSITGLAFNPDFVWLKRRSSAQAHYLYDVIRGTSSVLYSDGTDAEQSISTGLTSFNSDGFSLGSLSGVNASSSTYVGWAWDAGTSTVTNNSGSISSQVRANATAGFSVVTYTGTGTTATVGHGLGVAPELIICKRRNSAVDWVVYHKSTGRNGYLLLNTTAAFASLAGYWGASDPSSTVISYDAGGYGGNNASGGTYVAYCFSPVVGYSSFGTWLGSGTTDNGAFVYTGFRPRFILLKNTDNVEQWYIYDSSRSPYNVSYPNLTFLNPNTSASEGSYLNYATIDFVSNGFKIRGNTGSEISFVGRNYIYAAFAEAPLNYSRAR